MSFTIASSLPRRMIEPLPNAFSMEETASSIAFSFSGATGIFTAPCRGAPRPLVHPFASLRRPAF